MVVLEQLDDRLVARLSAAASAAVSAAETEADVAGEMLDDFHRELLASRAVDTELGVVNAERLRAGLPPVGETDRRWALSVVLGDLFRVRGRIGLLLADDSWDELNINSPDRALLTYADGRKELIDPPLFDDEVAVLAWLQTTARRGSDVGEFTFDAAHPCLAMQLGDVNRLYALWGGKAQAGLSPTPIISIRRHRLLRHRLDDLIESGLCTPEVGRFLKAAVKAKRTLIISGGTGTGKTTCARALAHEADPDERIITVELTRELFLEAFPDAHHDVVALETRAANTEGEGHVSLADLVSHTLRLHPDRIWLGEILGPADVTAFLNALSGGHRGSCATLHANAAAAVPVRLQSLCLQSPQRLTVDATNALIASSVDFIVHLNMTAAPGGRISRYVEEIIEIAGLDGNRVLYNQVFTPGPDGRATPAGPMTPANTHALTAVGYDHSRVPR